MDTSSVTPVLFNATVTPGKGGGLADHGMFYVDISPSNPDDTLSAVHIIVSLQNQKKEDFVAFAYIDALAEGQQITAVLYASDEAVKLNAEGIAINVSVVAKVNGHTTQLPTVTFTEALWPEGIIAKSWQLVSDILHKL